MIRTSHPSGLRRLCLRGNPKTQPLDIYHPQKIFGTIPCSIGVIANLMVVSQPLTDSRYGRTKENDLSTIAADTAAANQIWWFCTNPSTGSLLYPTLCSKQFDSIKGNLITHHIIGCPGNLVAECFNRDDPVPFCFLPLIKPLGFSAMPHAKVCGFYISPW